MRRLAVFFLLLPVLVMGACVDSTKTSTPLSPSIAGPIPGVNITAPTTIQPTVGAKVPNDQQPLTLVVGNASTSGVRPLTYVFEVAADAGFSSVLFSRQSIPPGAGGQTSLRLPDALATDLLVFLARARRGRCQHGPVFCDYRVQCLHAGLVPGSGSYQPHQQRNGRLTPPAVLLRERAAKWACDCRQLFG